MKSYFDCIVIGAGVAGMTSAIYLKRYNINCMILEKAMYGGQINQTLNIENYPGFEQIEGPTLAHNIYNQVKKLNIPYEYGNVVTIEKKENIFHITTDITTYMCKSVIIATGRHPSKLDLKNEQELIGKGISFCATCDGMLYKNKKVIVVGGGNSALEEALYLSKICTQVNLLHRRDQFRADAILSDKVTKQNNIKIYYNTEIKEYWLENGTFKGAIITQKEERNPKPLEANGIFLYIGYEPSTQFLENLDIELENGYIIVDNQRKTKVDGIFACGDVIKKEVYQIVTATSDGSIAANSVKNYLENESSNESYKGNLENTL